MRSFDFTSIKKTGLLNIYTRNKFMVFHDWFPMNIAFVW